MNIVELKQLVESKKLMFNLLVFKYKDNSFLANEYLDEIVKQASYKVNYIETLEESVKQSNSLFDFSNDNVLNVLKTTKLETSVDDLYNVYKTIVICNSINEVLETKLKTLGVLVEFPKIEDWQIKAYMQYKCPGLSTQKIDWLYDITKGDIYRIANELSKIDIFNKEDQDALFNQIDRDGGYSDLSSLTVFNLINSVMKRDGKYGEILKEIDNIDVDSYGLITLLYNNIKNVINIQMGKNVTAESLKMPTKQFQAIRYNCGKYTNEQLIKMFEFVSYLDYRIKTGEFQNFSKNRLIEYIIFNLVV